MKKIVLIANPISGQGKAKKAALLTKEVLDQKNHDVHIEYTKHAGHATTLAQNLSQQYDIVVAVGGDGTVNEVAQGLIESGKTLGIIPTGSGNGLARHLKIPMNTKSAALCIDKEKKTSIDTPTINGKHFFCTAGIGFDAHISHVFSKMSGRGLSNYVKAIFKEYGSYKAGNYTLAYNNQTETDHAFVITVGNAAQYGNEAMITPLASIKDGQLDVTILKKPSLITAMNWGIRLFMGNIHKGPNTKYFSTKKLTIDTTTNEKVVNGHRDGEPDQWSLPLEFSINEGRTLNVIVNSDEI
ncbi:diacylglycerol kinase family protein [Flammeovirga sp. SubArs3]|uniref:diacylglycerol/lipid kinase family protein n=1 Tax=Flammeovirga sp. SubArs3 TaxID=2995316 RepID=UPI00248C3B3B|nr:diacylglycerol kinase family protein [Flammeovirga sp. SubArs3]